MLVGRQPLLGPSRAGKQMPCHVRAWLPPAGQIPHPRIRQMTPNPRARLQKELMI